MKIGIDASRAFIKDPTGTERYAFEVITRMLRLAEARKHEWVLYTRGITTTSPLTPLLNSGEGNKRGEVKVRLVNISLKFLWTQMGLALRTWLDDLDVLWVPAHTLPVFRKPGIKSIVTIHGIEYEWLPAYENRLQRWYLPLSTKYAVLSAKKIIAVSEFTKRQLIKRLGADPNKIQVVYEGFDSQILNSKSEIPSKLQILNKYKIKPKQYVLFVGTVQPRKNLVRLVEAFSYLTPDPSPNPGEGRIFRKGVGSGLKLVIAGKLGWMYDDILKAPENYGVKDRVIFTGYVNDNEREILLKNALVYVQPSITEGFGLPVLEAMAAGIPVVSSHGGALKEIIGDAGVLFDPGEVKDMKVCLEKILGDSELQRKLVQKGRRRVEEFGWEKTAEETLKLITDNHNLIV